MQPKGKGQTACDAGLPAGDCRLLSSSMKLLAAIGVHLVFACLIGLGMIMAVSSGSLWLLSVGSGLFLLAFIKFGCINASHS
jgi:hypothetical protein